MKILIHAVAAKSGGGETYLLNLMGDLARTGKRHHFTLCVSPRLAVKIGEQWDNVTLVLSEAGFETPWRRFLWDQWQFRRMARRSDCVFLTSDFGMLFPPRPQVLMLQNPLFFSPYYLREILPLKSRFFRIQFLLRRRLVVLSARHSSAVMAPSQDMLDSARRFVPLPAGRAVVNPFGVSAERFGRAPESRTAQRGPLRLLHVSEYCDHKNLAVLLRAIPLLREQGLPDVRLTTTADPSHFPGAELATRETDRSLLSDPGISPFVRNAGTVPYEEIHRLYQESDIFVFPSIAESFGHPLAEAMAAGLPVVASDIPICREICGDAALYFDPADPGDLARKISLLWNDAGMRKLLGDLGEARAKTRFSWKNHAARLLEILEIGERAADHSTETLLLKLAAAAGRTPESIPQAFARHPRPDWDALYGLANRHQMIGILAPRLLNALNGPFPAQVRSRWASRWRLLAAGDLAQKAALAEILAAAGKTGIRPLLLKGFAVQTQAYPADTARGACDIDLLVRRPDFPEMVSCLERLGFVFRGKDGWGRPFPHWSAMLKKTHEAPFHRSSDGVTVELHGSLCSPLEERLSGLKLRDRLWENPRQIAMGRLSCAIPGREEELLFLSLHLLKAGPFFLRSLSDLVHLLKAAPPVDWDRFLSLAQASGTRTVTYYALELAARIRPDVAPSRVRTALAPAGGLRWLFSSSLRLERLLETHGEEPTNLGLKWRGVLFARRPWLWIPYQCVLAGKRGLRQIQAVLR